MVPEISCFLLYPFNATGEDEMSIHSSTDSDAYSEAADGFIRQIRQYIPSSTMRIFSSALYFFRVGRRISRTTASADTFSSFLPSDLVSFSRSQMGKVSLNFTALLVSLVLASYRLDLVYRISKLDVSPRH